MAARTLESARQFAVSYCMHPQCSGGERDDPCCRGLTQAIEADRKAVALAVLDWVENIQDDIGAAYSWDELRRRIESGDFPWR